MLRIAHTCANSNSGMANVVRDEVMAERKLGVDARMIFPREHKFSPAFTGRGAEGVEVGDIQWAQAADVLVVHSGLNAGENKWKKPRIAVAHGNPYHSFISERMGGMTPYRAITDQAKMPFCYKLVTYWALDVPYWEAVTSPGMVALVPLSVNLDEWQPGPAKPEFFGSLRGDINIVSTSRFRVTLDPFPVWNAFNVFADKFPDKKVRLHIYGTDADFTGTPPLFGPLYRKQRLGHLMPSVTADDLRTIYHSADMCITAHRTESLTIRESMACGCPVVGDITLETTPYAAPIHDAREYANEMLEAYEDRQSAGTAAHSRSMRELAEKHFQPEPTARAFIKLCEEAVEAKKPRGMSIRPAPPSEMDDGVILAPKTRQLKDDNDPEIQKALGREPVEVAGNADPTAFDYPGLPVDGEGAEF